VKIGIGNVVMPGARLDTMMVTKLTSARMAPGPDSARPVVRMPASAPGEWVALVSGE
jgi:hypothetical protein